MLSAKRNGDAAKRFVGKSIHRIDFNSSSLKKMLKDAPLPAPGRIGIDGDRAFPGAIDASVRDGSLPQDPVHYVTKHLQQGIESDHFRVKKLMTRSGRFQSFNTAR